jgi:hypothetical protein
MERSATTTLRRVSTQEALVDALRSEILSGAVAPGTALKEGELCARFGVSRHTRGSPGTCPIGASRSPSSTGRTQMISIRSAPCWRSLQFGT